MPRVGGQHLLWPPFRPLADQFGHDFFRALPESPGVYLMCGEGDGVLYVGKARNLRQRLSNHRSTPTELISRKQRRLLQSVRRIYWDVCADEAAADQRERELIRTLQPRFNTVGVRPAAPRFLVWHAEHEALDLELELEPVTELEPEPEPVPVREPDLTEGRAGPFSGMRGTHAALLRLMWWVTHPQAGPHDLPRELRSERPPDAWRFAWTADVKSGWETAVKDWKTGTPKPLIEWLACSLGVDLSLRVEAPVSDEAGPGIVAPAPDSVVVASPIPGTSKDLFLHRWQESDLQRLMESTWSPGKGWNAGRQGGAA